MPTHPCLTKEDFMRLPNLRFLLALLSLGVVSLATAASTIVILPDGSNCTPTGPQSQVEVMGGHVDYLCGDDGDAGLVGGLLFSGDKATVEYARFTPGSEPLEVNDQQLMSFAPLELELANGSKCHALGEPLTLLGEYRANFKCSDEIEMGNLYLVGGLWVEDGTVMAHRLRLSDDLSQRLSFVSSEVRLLDAALPLTKVLWRLASFGTGFDAPLAGAEPTLQFLPGRIAGDAGCNRYFASATLRGKGDLVLGPAGSTLMACEEERMALEQRYLKALAGVSYYEIIDGKLYLFGSGETMMFEAAGPAGED